MITQTSNLQGVGLIKNIRLAVPFEGSMNITFDELVSLYPEICTGKAAPFVNSKGIVHEFQSFYYCESMEIEFDDSADWNGLWSVTLSLEPGYLIVIEFLYPMQRKYFLMGNWQFLAVDMRVQWLI